MRKVSNLIEGRQIENTKITLYKDSTGNYTSKKDRSEGDTVEGEKKKQCLRNE